MSGMDILDQAAGLTAFVHDYLHIDWDDANQNDKSTNNIHEVAGTISDGLGTVALNAAAFAQNTFSPATQQVQLLAPQLVPFAGSTGRAGCLGHRGPLA